LLLGCAGREGSSANDAPAGGEFLAVEESRIDATTADLSRASYLLVARNGDILVGQTEDGHIKVFGQDGSISTIGRSGGGPGEFNRLTRIGWLGDSLWTLDPGLMRISLFGPDYEFVRSYPSPGGNPAAADGTEPYSTFLQAVLPEGQHRVLVSTRTGMERPGWLAAVDSGENAYARVDAAGSHPQLLAINPIDPCWRNWKVGTAGSAGMKLPYCEARLSTDWDGTVSLGFVDAQPATGDSASYRVTVIGPAGDTTVVKDFFYTPIPVNQAMIDSAHARRAAIDSQSNPAFLANRPEITYPASLPPVKRLVLGRDATVWIELEDNAAPHTWQVLDPHGEEVGRVTLPEAFRLMTADRDRIWGLERDADDLESIVTYRLQAGDS
jgi:hypothetical protein